MTRVWARVNEDIQVGYGTDIDVAASVIDRVGREMGTDPAWRRSILEPPKLERVQGLGDSGVTLKILATVRAPERWAVAGELRRRLLTAFAAEGVEIPFPHRVIVSRPASGDAPDQRRGRRSRGSTPDPDSGISADNAAASGAASMDVGLD